VTKMKPAEYTVAKRRLGKNLGGKQKKLTLKNRANKSLQQRGILEIFRNQGLPPRGIGGSLNQVSQPGPGCFDLWGLQSHLLFLFYCYRLFLFYLGFSVSPLRGRREEY
jgi:hypothetical protein